MALLTNSSTVIICPACGHSNDPEALVCALCGSHLRPPDVSIDPVPAADEPVRQSVAVKAFALLSTLVGGAVAVLLAVSASGALVTLLGAAGIAAYSIAAAFGLWRHRNWGRLMLILGLGLAFLGGVALLVLVQAGRLTTVDLPTLPGWIAALAALGAAEFWLLKNGGYFR